MGSWVKACTRSQIEEGSLFSFDHNNKRILIANLKGKIYATDLICTHAKADLSTGFLTEDGIRCPLHLSVFDLETGVAKNPPAERPLATYNVKIDKDEIYVEV